MKKNVVKAVGNRFIEAVQTEVCNQKEIFEFWVNPNYPKFVEAVKESLLGVLLGTYQTGKFTSDCRDGYKDALLIIKDFQNSKVTEKETALEIENAKLKAEFAKLLESTKKAANNKKKSAPKKAAPKKAAPAPAPAPAPVN